MDRRFAQCIAKASGGRLDVEALEPCGRLQDLPDVVIETARALRYQRIAAIRLVHQIVRAPLGEISCFLDEVAFDSLIAARDWRRHPEVYARSELGVLARGELEHVLGGFGEVVSAWFVREPCYLAWRIGNAAYGAPFKVAHGEHETWQPPGRLLRSCPRSYEPARELAPEEAGEAVARWVVSRIAHHLEGREHAGDAASILAALRAASQLEAGVEPSRFFVACCALAARELAIAGPRQVPGFVGPSGWYRLGAW